MPIPPIRSRGSPGRHGPSLVADLGYEPVDGGGLERAGLLAAMVALMVPMWPAGVDARAIVPPLEYAFGDRSS